MKSRIGKTTAAAVAAVCALLMLGSCAAQDIFNNLPGENANELYASTPDATAAPAVTSAADTAVSTDTAADSAAPASTELPADSSLADSSSVAEERIVAVSAPPTPYAADYFLDGESDQLKDSYRKLYEGIFSYQSTIELPEKAVAADEIEDLINFVLKTGSALDMPGSRYEVLVDSDNYVTKVNLSYNHSMKDGMAMYDTLMKRVDEIAKEAEPLLSDYDKLKYFHDTIINGCMYDALAPDAHTAYGALCGGRAVCDGYAKAFQLLCEKANIASLPVYGKSINTTDGTTEDHIWNKVSCGGEWFVVDVTWDDPVGDTQVLRYDYFLIDDATSSRSATPAANRYMTVPSATDAYNDYYTRNGLVINYDNDLYYQFNSLVTANMAGEWSEFTVDFRCLDQNLFDQIKQEYFTEASDGSKGFGNMLQDYMAPGEALRYTFSDNPNIYSYHITVTKG